MLVFTSQTRIGGPNLEIKDAHQNEAFDIGTMKISLGVVAGLRLKIKGSFETYFFRTMTVQPAASTANQLTDFNEFCAEKSMCHCVSFYNVSSNVDLQVCCNND